MDFGVNVCNEGFVARFYDPDIKKCSIKLYEKGAKEPSDIIEMQSVKGAFRYY